MGSLPSASSTTSSHSQTRQRRRATSSTVAELLERTGMFALSDYAICGTSEIVRPRYEEFARKS
jgi:hypothetical protein